MALIPHFWCLSSDVLQHNVSLQKREIGNVDTSICIIMRSIPLPILLALPQVDEGYAVVY